MGNCPIDHPIKNIRCEIPVDETDRHAGEHFGGYELDYEDENGEVAHKTVTEEWPNVYKKK